LIDLRNARGNQTRGTDRGDGICCITMAEKKALIIEDSKVIGQTLTRYLEKEGYTTVQAFDGEEGLVKFGEDSPDITFLDILMPKRDGIEVLKIIKELDPAATIVMITASMSKEIVKEAEAANADWFVLKPFSRQQIHEIIQWFEGGEKPLPQMPEEIPPDEEQEAEGDDDIMIRWK